MTEEVAVRIAEALESIANSTAVIEALIICFVIIFGIILFFHIITKDD